MEKNLMMDFSVNKEKHTITVKREFAAELPLVWEAYTKNQILDQWWAPRPWKARTKTMDFRVGGRWHYAMIGPKGEKQWAITQFLNIQPEKSFIATDSFADAEGNINKEMPQSTWNIKFTPKEDDLTLVEMQVTFPDLAQLEKTLQMGVQDGLTIAMEGLDELLTLEINKVHPTD